jgi:hypothetical protein
MKTLIIGIIGYIAITGALVMSLCKMASLADRRMASAKKGRTL